jgi:prepilin-type processing-associated H-X9-DG protein
MIALLAAILFPVFSQARKKGQQTACFSNLHQIGLAAEAYAADTGGFLPLANAQPSLTGPPSIAEVMSAYAKDKRIFRCPADDDEKWPTEGTSYYYGQGLLDIGMRPQRIDFPYKIDASQFQLAYDMVKAWHPRGINCLYADGHVKNVGQ